MLDSLFQMELPLPVKLLVAFGIVLVLLALVMWIFRRLSGNRVGGAPARGRQPRLAVIDAAPVDARRRLVLIRRDNVEHLVMIGGPSDVLIEQNIVRAVPVAATREPHMQRPPSEPAQRMPPEAMHAEPTPRGPRLEPPPRALRPEPMPRRPAPERPRAEPPPGFPPRGAPEGARARMQSPSRPEPEFAPEGQTAPGTADSNLADMAHKLEAALRRPSASRRPQPIPPPSPPALAEPPPPTAPEANGTSASPANEPASHSVASPASQRNQQPRDGAPGSQSLLDSLEQEMASLLNRPPEKPPEKK